MRLDSLVNDLGRLQRPEVVHQEMQSLPASEGLLSGNAPFSAPSAFSAVNHLRHSAIPLRLPAASMAFTMIRVVPLGSATDRSAPNTTCVLHEVPERRRTTHQRGASPRPGVNVSAPPPATASNGAAGGAPSSHGDAGGIARTR